MAVDPMLSKNFRRSELACRCCGVCIVSDKLVAGLQALRELAGVPIVVTSGFRCSKHNRTVGGVPYSRHLLGQAADIVIHGMTPKEMYWAAMEIPCFRDGGIGIYVDRGFIHVDVRNGPARWAEMDGKKVRYYDGSK